MTFKIKRTSEWDKDKKPCDEAVATKDGWYVEIDTIEQLAGFTMNYGEIVFDPECIEIYDDYRE